MPYREGLGSVLTGGKFVDPELDALQKQILAGDTTYKWLTKAIDVGQQDQFVGRKKETEQIMESIGAGQSVWIYAESRSGKSSLLKHIVSGLSNEATTGVLEFDLQGESGYIDDEQPKNTTLAEKVKASFKPKKTKKETEAVVAESLERRIKKNLLRQQVDMAGKSTLVMMVDEVIPPNFYAIKALPVVLKRILPEVENFIFIMAGFTPIEQFKSDLKASTGNAAPDWLPSREIFLEPAIPPEMRKLVGAME